MPKSEEEYERIRVESKERIMDAAIEVFAKKGYAATNTNDIASAANISAGLMYRYFRSKRELFECITQSAMEGLIGVIATLNGEGEPKEILEKICRELLIELDNDAFIYITMTMMQGILSEGNPTADVLLAHDKEMFLAAERLIARGQKAGVFGSGDPAAKSALLFSSIQGLAIMKFLLKGDLTLPSVSELTAFLY